MDKSERYRMWTVIGIACGLALVLLFIWGSRTLAAPLEGALARAYPEADVRILPEETDFNCMVTVDVQVEHVIGLFGASYRLTFDPQVLQVVDADPTKPGVQVQGGEIFTEDAWENSIVDNTTGVITYTASFMTKEKEFRAQEALLSRITFLMKGTGVSHLEFDLSGDWTHLSRNPDKVPPWDTPEIPTTWHDAMLTAAGPCRQLLLPLVLNRAGC